MSLSYKTFGNRIYVTNLAAGGILKLQQSGPDVTLIRLDDNTVDLSYLKKDIFYSFSGLNELTQTHVIVKQLVLDLNHDNIEFLNGNQDQTIAYLDSIETNVATSFINSIFNKIKDLETIDEVYIEFFSIFSSYSNDSDTKSEIRSKIIKQSGESDFIAKEFGIENFFTLNDFEERIADRIRNAIDLELNQGDVYEFEATRGLISGDASNSPENNRNLLRLTPNGRGRKVLNFSNFEDIEIGQDKWHTEAFKQLDERAGSTESNDFGSDSIPYKELQNSQLYENPIRYDFVAPYDIKGEKQDIYPYSELGRYYNPSTERVLWDRFTKWLNGPSTSNTTGIDEIILGYYIRFVFGLEQEAEDSNLSRSIGQYFDEIVDMAFPYIMNWMIVHYENLVRYNLAKLVAEMPVDELETTGTEDALAIAEAAADLNLQGLQGDLGEEELTEEDIQQRVQLYKQCALLMNVDNLNNDYVSIIKSRRNAPIFGCASSMHLTSFYNNRFYMVNSKDDNLTIKNKLISPSGQKIKPFMEITPDIASALRPRLRLYKVYKDGDKTVSFEFPFPSHTDGERVMTFNGQEIDRGDGLGIKSFNFSFDGETPATSQQYISANLSLFFQTFPDFVKERVVPNGRSDGQEEKFRYADLFVNTKFCPQDISKTSPLNYDPQFYRLRVDVGWEPRDDDSFKQIIKNRGLSPDLFNQAILAMNKSFYLNLIDHEINISDSGTVTISANYIAYIEGLMENNNVLISPEAKELQDEFVEKYETELKKRNCDPQELAELRASINALRVSSRNILHQSLVSKLVKNNCLYYTQINSRDRREFARKKFFSKKPELVPNNLIAYRSISSTNGSTDILGLAEEIANSSKTTTEDYNYIMDKFRSNPKQNNMERISFFYMSDLVYYLLDSLYVDGEPEEQIKIILSSFSLNIPFTGDVEVNIGQIPIEIEVFTKWYKQEIVDKELDSISFLEFIKRLTFYLITDIFSEICIDEQQHKRLSFMNAAINSVKNNGKGTLERLLNIEPIIDISVPYNSGTLPLVTSTINQERLSPTDFVQYLLIYPHYRPETHVGRALAFEDAKRGVHHLYIGADRGILKNASFSKTDIQYLRESRMLTQGENGLLQLSSLYRTNLKMIGNTIFYPGMLLYLNPFGFGGMDFGLPHQGPGTVEEPNLANIMGIGGYQKVVKVSSTISESGKFETDVECIFEHTGEPPREDADNTERSPGQRTGRGQQNVRKITCKDLDKADANAPECNPSDLSRDLQNKLLELNRTGTIDSREQENE